MSFLVTLPLPPSANRYWRMGRNKIYLSDEAVAYKLQVANIFQHLDVKPIEGDIEIVMTVYRKQRSGDLDNKIKVLLDAMQGLAYHDDKQIVAILAYRRDDRANPRVNVWVGPPDE